MSPAVGEHTAGDDTTRTRIPLRGDASTRDPRADRIDDKDEESRQYPASAMFSDWHYAHPRSYTWRCTTLLDQGPDGACVGFAWTHELIARPVEVPGLNPRFAREEVYFAAQRVDRFAGGEYPGAEPVGGGTSVLAGAKVVQELGYCTEYRWAFDLQDLVASVGYRGPAVFGCRWYEGMREVDDDGRVHVDGSAVGGHCVLVNSVRVRRTDSGEVDPEASTFSFVNSWGRGWGRDGTARLSFADVQRLWDGAETCIPVSRRP